MTTTATPVYTEIGGVPHIGGVPVFPIYGATSPGRMGILSSGDTISARNLLLTSLGDGFDLTTLWEEFESILDHCNLHRTGLASLIRYPVTEPGSAIPQGIQGVKLEVATEYGVPVSVGPPLEAVVLGYKFDDYDVRNAYTYRFLKSATVENVRAVTNSILAGDDRLVNGLVMFRLFNNKVEHNKEGFACRGLWTGDDGMRPPPYLGVEFPEDTNHYLTSGNGVIDSQDVEDLVKLVRSKGFGLAGSGQTLFLICNPVESEAVQTWLSGKESRPGGPLAKFDWVPSVSAPPHYSEDTLVGQAVSGDFQGVQGVEILGTYGYVRLIESAYVPPQYIAVVASGGPNSPANCVGFREDPAADMRGLRIIPGSDWGQYPILGAFYLRSCGVGVRQRGSAAVMQITTNATYTPPPGTVFGL
jgi:hypothetical protein